MQHLTIHHEEKIIKKTSSGYIWAFCWAIGLLRRHLAGLVRWLVLDCFAGFLLGDFGGHLFELFDIFYMILSFRVPSQVFLTISFWDLELSDGFVALGFVDGYRAFLADFFQTIHKSYCNLYQFNQKQYINQKGKLEVQERILGENSAANLKYVSCFKKQMINQ